MYRPRIFSAALTLIFVLTAFGTVSYAGVSFLFDKSQYIANHPDQAVQTFEDGNVAPGGFQFCDAVLINSSSGNPCFNPGDILPGLEFFLNPAFAFGSFSLAGVNASGFGNLRKALGRQTDGTEEFIEITFPPPGVSSAGVATGCFDGQPPCDGISLFQVYGAGGVLLDEITIPVTGVLETFIGFDSTTPVERVTVSDFQGNATFEAITEVRFDQAGANVPTLGEWGMISAAVGLALIGVLFAVKRRKAKAGI